METKICFKCEKELPATDFYKHKQMPDGRLNKCKGCAREDARDSWDRKKDDPVFREKEKVRCREKYKRLNYKEKQLEWDVNRPWKKTSTYKNLRRDLKVFMRRNGLSGDYSDAHHWCYSFLDEVFLVSRSDHREIHKVIIFDKDILMYRDLNGKLLDSKEKHESVVKSVTNDFLFVKIR